MEAEKREEVAGVALLSMGERVGLPGSSLLQRGRDVGDSCGGGERPSLLQWGEGVGGCGVGKRERFLE